VADDEVYLIGGVLLLRLIKMSREGRLRSTLQPHSESLVISQVPAADLKEREDLP
jgi:hypothetical protein